MSPPWGGDNGPPSVPTLNRGRLDAIERDVSREFLVELVGLFVTDVAARLERLSDAVKARQTKRASSLAHALQGSAASLGVLRLRAVAQRLEELTEADEWGASDATLARLIDEFQHVRQVLVAIGSEASSDRAAKP
ncbi:MAG TPA: Hpt domain-containing protein [Polyangiaceae bacterium]|nr:Hpt domain-containing protein [Polyangiaceae bacterium]